jgi:hypothetical protein
MKQQTKATLLSALAFPGLGQLVVLKRPVRGLIFLLPALGAFSWLMYGLAKGTNALMAEALKGTLAPDPILIATRLTEASQMPGAEIAAWILVASWLASIIDAQLPSNKT